MKELLEAGVHFGHQTSRWNPKMKRFIYGAKNGIYIIDLQKTADGLSQAREFLRSVGAQGGPVLFVGTKRQAQPIIAEEATRCGQYYVNLRWLGGLLTNFQTIRKSIDRLKTLRQWREDGTFSRFTKKEVAIHEKEMHRFEKVLSGIIDMNRLPRAIFIVDTKREETAIAEANRLGIPVVALVDTNCDPDKVSYVIPGNDDAIRSLKLVTSHLADAIQEGYQSYLAGKAAEEEAARAKAEAAKAPAPPPEPEAPALEQTSAEPPVVETIPPVDEVEAIVPEAVLKVKVEAADTTPKKKRTPKVKETPKAEEKPPVD